MNKKHFTTKELAKQFDTTEPFIRYIINTLEISRINPGVKKCAISIQHIFTD